MKSLADIAGFGNSPLQKVMVDYSFNLTPNAKDIQDALFSGKEPSGLVEVRQYIVDTTQEQNPKQKTTTKFLPPQFRTDDKGGAKPKKIEPSEMGSFEQEDKKMSERFAKEKAELDAWNKKNKNNKSSEFDNSTKTSKEKEDLEETEVKNKKRQQENLETLAKIYSDPQTDEDVNSYLSANILLNKGGVNKSMVDLMKKDMGQYINSPTYAQRQANFPEQYIGGSALSYQKRKYETAIAKEKRTQRSGNLNTVPVSFDESRFKNYFDPNQNKIVLSKDGIPSVAVHELTHSSAKNSKVKQSDILGYNEMGDPILPQSDIVNTKFWDATVSKGNKAPVSAGLNMSEMKKFVELAKPTIDKKGDVHADKDSDIRQFSGEQYGDLMGVRNLLYKSGITKSFGEELNKEKLDKALKDKKVNDDPVFKRFLFRYGANNVIQLNNTIAMNSQSMSNKSSNA